MAYEKSYPVVPSVCLIELSDQQRKFSPRKWDLQAAQNALTKKSIDLIPSRSASECMENDLGWKIQHLLGFFNKLQTHHYICSEWIYIADQPKINGLSVAYPADVYVMGYNKALGQENERMNPKIYFKFIMKPGFLIVANCHTEKSIGERGL